MAHLAIYVKGMVTIYRLQTSTNAPFNSIIADPFLLHKTAIMPHKLLGDMVSHLSNSWAFCKIYYLWCWAASCCLKPKLAGEFPKFARKLCTHDCMKT